MNGILGMNILWIFLGGHHTTGLGLGVISMHSVISFFESVYRMGIFFWSAKISNILLGMLHYSR